MNYTNLVRTLAGSIWLSSEEQMGSVLEVSEAVFQGRSAVVNKREEFMANHDREQLHTGAYRVKITNNGTAVVPVFGLISPKANLMMSWSGGTSAQSLRNVAIKLKTDQSVRRVVLNIDSGGGSALGVPEAAQAIRELAKTKPVIAVINGIGASGAYWIASAANKIVVEPSSIVGSVGVYSLIVTYAEQLENDGIDARIIRKGKLKAVPNSVEEFTDEGIAQIQKGVDRVYDEFVNAIATNRKISMKKALALADGTVETGSDAVGRGFADEVGLLENVIGSVDNGDYDAIVEHDEDEPEAAADNVSSVANANASESPVAAEPVKDDLKTDLDAARAEVDAARKEARELRAQIESEKIESVIASAIENGKLLATKAEDARQMAKQHGVDVLVQFVSMTPENKKLEDLSSNTEVKNDPYAGDPNAPRTEEAKRIFSMFPNLKKKYNL